MPFGRLHLSWPAAEASAWQDRQLLWLGRSLRWRTSVRVARGAGVAHGRRSGSGRHDRQGRESTATSEVIDHLGPIDMMNVLRVTAVPHRSRVGPATTNRKLQTVRALGPWRSPKANDRHDETNFSAREYAVRAVACAVMGVCQPWIAQNRTRSWRMKSGCSSKTQCPHSSMTPPSADWRSPSR